MGYRLGYSGPEVDVLLQKAYKYSVVNNGWAKLDSSDSNPVDLNSLVTQGNYSISFWNNGPVQLNTSGPINVCVTKDSSNGKTYQTIYDAGKVYLRETTGTSFSNTWIEEQNNTDLDINASVPQNPQDNYVWIDTSGEEPTIKVYKESTHSWVPVSAADLAKTSVYDPQGIKQPIDTYLNQKIADADLSKAEQDYNAHLIEGESSGNPIHVTTEEKAKWNAGIAKDDASTIVNALKTEMTSYANEKINTSTQEVSNISDNVNRISSNIDAHIADSSIHLTAEDVTNFDNKAAGNHKHLNDGHVTVSAANITGMIAVERLDPSVLERNYTVTSYEEMMALTKNEIQNGDSVFINGTKQSAWFVVDDTKLGEETYEVKENIISDTSRYWNSVCYGNDKFVAVARNDNTFAYSTDGINWTEGTISSTNRCWQSVCYGNDKYVVVGFNEDSEYNLISGNDFAYSTDGITWTEGTISSTSRKWWSVCYGNDKFVAVANNNFAYSTDGIAWTENAIGSIIYRQWNSVCYASIPNIEFSNNHTGISSDVTDVNGISSMTTYTEQYTEDVYYIHYAWVDRASSSLVRYNILTRKIDTSSGIPVISNVASYTTTFSIGTIAHPSFHKDKNGIHCAFYHGNTTYTKYYKLTRSGTDDSTWSWGVDSNTYITNENISLMVNKNENNLQSSLAQSARRMYMVNSSDNLVEFKKTQTF